MKTGYLPEMKLCGDFLTKLSLETKAKKKEASPTTIEIWPLTIQKYTYNMVKSMLFIRFLIRIGLGSIFAFCWSIIGVIVGINAPESSLYFVYAFGIVIIFLFGLSIGGRLAKKWFPVKEETMGISKDEEESMKAAYKRLSGKE